PASPFGWRDGGHSVQDQTTERRKQTIAGLEALSADGIEDDVDASILRDAPHLGRHVSGVSIDDVIDTETPEGVVLGGRGGPDDDRPPQPRPLDRRGADTTPRTWNHDR